MTTVLDKQDSASPTRTMASGVYSIVSNVNDRVYVGSSNDITIRWKNHRSQLRRGVHHNPHLQNSWNLYGEDAFEFVILEECAVSVLRDRECHWLNEIANKYNCIPVDRTSVGHRQTPETREKIRQTLMGHAVGEETRSRIGKSGRGRIVTPETRAKISSSMKGIPKSEETRRRMKAAQQSRSNKNRQAPRAGE